MTKRLGLNEWCVWAPGRRWLLPMALWTFACNGSSGAVFGQQIASATCAKIFECCTEAEIETMGSGFVSFSDEQSCVSAYEQLYTAFGSVALDQAEAEGRLRFNSSAADACVAKIQNATCEEFRNNDDTTECDGAVEPLVKSGGKCASDAECIDGVCEGGSLFGEANGTCAPLPGEGDPCDFDCAQGLTCQIKFSGGTSSSICVRPSGPNQDCSEHNLCVAGHTCQTNASESVCVALPTQGEDCTLFCAEGLYCRSSDTTCQPQKAAGESCTTTTECLGYCDLQAGTPGTCAGSGGICGG